MSRVHDALRRAEQASAAPPAQMAPSALAPASAGLDAEPELEAPPGELVERGGLERHRDSLLDRRLSATDHVH